MEDSFITKKLKYNSLKKTIKNDKSMINYGTIDGLHEKFMAEIDKQKKILPKHQQKLNSLKSELNKLLNKPTVDITVHDINKKAELLDSIEDTQDSIDKILLNVDEIDYFTVAIPSLLKYYEKKDDSIIISEQTNEAKTLLDFFDTTKKSKKINKENTLFEEYIKCTMNKIMKNTNVLSQLCPMCNVEKILHPNDGHLVCGECGHTDQIIVDMEKINFKDPFYENKSTKYKRMNHFSELMNQFQAKESTEIPTAILNNIIIEIKKQKISNPSKLTKKKMRSILKKLDLNIYFEHVPFIINKLTGLPPPNITREIEEKLKSMFKEIELPFEMFKPKNRKNFLNYNYIFYKFFELLELDHFLPHFTLLKSHTKRREQDEVWEKICKYLKWEYIPSN